MGPHHFRNGHSYTLSSEKNKNYEAFQEAVFWLSNLWRKASKNKLSPIEVLSQRLFLRFSCFDQVCNNSIEKGLWGGKIKILVTSSQWDIFYIISRKNTYWNVTPCLILEMIDLFKSNLLLWKTFSNLF